MIARTGSPTSRRLSTTGEPLARRTRRFGQSWLGWLYAAPAAMVLLFLFIVPLVLAVWMSFNKWPLLGDVRKFNFPDNYTRIAQDELFLNSVIFTLKYTAIITVVLLVLSFGLALFVQEGKRRTTGILRTAYFLPVVTGLTTAALLFLGLLNPTVGPFSELLAGFGIRIDWLGDPNLALLSTVLMMTWRFAGFYMIIMLSGLQAIPRELYEAAAMDGANRWRSLLSVTLPLMRSTVSLCLVLIVTGGLVAFEQFYVLTGGGPDNSTVTMVMTIFRQAFSQFNLGTAAALSVVVLLGLVVLNVMQLRVVREDQDGDKR